MTDGTVAVNHRQASNHHHPNHKHPLAGTVNRHRTRMAPIYSDLTRRNHRLHSYHPNSSSYRQYRHAIRVARVGIKVSLFK